MIIWRKNYDNVHVGYMGEVRVFNVFWDGCVPKNQEKTYALTCTLPQSSQRTHYSTSEEAKQYAEVILGIWLHDAGLTEAEE